MKLCEKCGTPQNDDNFRCVECGAILGKPLSDEEEDRAKDAISDYIDDHVVTTDPFYVSRLDKILVVADIVGIVSAIMIMLFFSQSSDGDYLCLLLAGMFLLIAIDTAFPQIEWFFEKLRVELHYHVEHLEPSDLYLLGRKITKVVIPVFGYMGLAYILLNV